MVCKACAKILAIGSVAELLELEPLLDDEYAC